MADREEILKKGFQSIDNALNTEFELEGGSTPPPVVVTNSKNVIVADDDDKYTAVNVENAEPIISPEDEEYIETELKLATESISKAMDTLDEDLRVGSEARLFEVYATLATARITAINSYRDLQLQKKKLSIDETKVAIQAKNSRPKKQEETPQVNNNTLNVIGNLSFDQLTDMVKGMKK